MEKLKYKKRISPGILLTEEEREEIAIRIVNFMRSCLIIDDHISFGEHYGNYKSYYYIFGRFKFGESYWNRVTEKNNYNLSDEDLYNDFVSIGGMFERFKYHIRMNASIIHIKKLIEILGNKVASDILNDWAKKNMAVAIALKKISDELKEENEQLI